MEIATKISTEQDRPSGLVSRFEELVAERANHVAIVDDREQVPFGDVGLHARRVARALRNEGLQGKRIAMLVTQSARWVETFYGIVLASGAAVPLSHLHPENEQKYFVEASGAEAVIVSSELEASVSSYAAGRAVLSIDELRAAGDPDTVTSARNDDVALILYTSGTTGKPKGALITHGNLGSLAELLRRAWVWSVDDVLLHALPLHHLHGLGISLLTSLLSGSRSLMLERFDSARIWEALGSATVLMGVPTMHKKLLDAFEAAPPAMQTRWRAHAAGLRLVTSGSAALPASVAERWRSLTGSYPLERFGMTEIGVGMSNPVQGERRPGTCGPPLPGMKIRIVAEDGSDARPGEPGEIWIQGPTVFKGYDANPEATREAFVDGWFRSGDTASWDDGYVRILGRTSIDILKSGGYKLSALEIEELVRDHAAIADVAVVGLPDETWGEIAVAAVLLREGAALAEHELRDWAKLRIAPYKVPKRVVVLQDFPRNHVGKVLKPELKRMLVERLGPSLSVR